MHKVAWRVSSATRFSSSRSVGPPTSPSSPCPGSIRKLVVDDVRDGVGQRVRRLTQRQGQVVSTPEPCPRNDRRLRRLAQARKTSPEPPDPIRWRWKDRLPPKVIGSRHLLTWAPPIDGRPPGHRPTDHQERAGSRSTGSAETRALPVDARSVWPPIDVGSSRRRLRQARRRQAAQDARGRRDPQRWTGLALAQQLRPMPACPTVCRHHLRLTCLRHALAACHAGDTLIVTTLG